MDRRRLVGRRDEVIAQSGTEGHFIAGFHFDRVDHRRPELGIAEFQQFAQRFLFGAQLRGGGCGCLVRLAGIVLGGARVGSRRFRGGE